MKVPWSWALLWSLLLSAGISAGLYWASDGCFYVRDARNYVFPPLFVLFFVLFVVGDNKGKLVVVAGSFAVLFTLNSVLQENNTAASVETKAVQHLREKNKTTEHAPRSKQVLSEDANYTFTYIPAEHGFTIEATPRRNCCFQLRAFTIDSNGEAFWTWPTRPATTSDERL